MKRFKLATINRIFFGKDVEKIVAVDKFVATDWSQLLGTGFANLIGEAFLKFRRRFIKPHVLCFD